MSEIYLHVIQRTFFTKEMKNTIISLIIPSILESLKVYTGFYTYVLILFFNLHLNSHLTSLSSCNCFSKFDDFHIGYA